MNHAFTGTIYSSTKKCSCGSSWGRTTDPELGVSTPICPSCGATPKRLILRRVFFPHRSGIELWYNRSGEVITTTAQAVALAADVDIQISQGTFCQEDYLPSNRPMLQMTTLGSFIEWDILIKRAHLFTEDERTYLLEYVSSWFEEQALYRVTQGHVEDFLSTFHGTALEKPRRSWAQGLVHRVLALAYEDIEEGVA